MMRKPFLWRLQSQDLYQGLIKASQLLLTLSHSTVPEQRRLSLVLQPHCSFVANLSPFSYLASSREKLIHTTLQKRKFRSLSCHRLKQL